MTKKERAFNIIKAINKEYSEARSELVFMDPWQLLTAVRLSAMSTDVSVNKVTPVLFKKYPHPRDMAKAEVDEVEKTIKTVNHYKTKAKNLIAIAQKLVNDFDGQVPKTMEELTSLPGIARKSANVILQQGFGITEGIVVDTHVSRVSNRLKLTKEKDPKKIEKDLMKIIPKRDWGTFGTAVVLHGRYVCQARRPRCDDCVLNTICPSSVSLSESTR